MRPNKINLFMQGSKLFLEYLERKNQSFLPQEVLPSDLRQNPLYVKVSQLVFKWYVFSFYPNSSQIEGKVRNVE